MPLAAGVTWDYDLEKHDPAKGHATGETSKHSLTLAIVARRSDGSYRIDESTDGTTTDTFIIRSTDRGIEIESVSLDRKKVLWLPHDFGTGSTWNLTKLWRATADNETEEIEVPGYGVRECIRVRYDRFYDERWSPKRPDWYFNGYRWFVKGIGSVKEDFKGVMRPRNNGSVEVLPVWDKRELKCLKLPDSIK